MNQVVVCLTILITASHAAVAQMPRHKGNSTEPINRVTLDVFVREDSERCRELRRFLEDFVRERQSLDVQVHDVDTDSEARSHLVELFRRNNIKTRGVPAIHVLNRFHVGYEDTPEYQRKITSLLDIEVFVRSGCSRCRDAKAYLPDLERRWPAIRLIVRDIATDVAARDRLATLANHYQVQATSVPAFHLCRRLKVGYQGAHITGRELEAILRACSDSVVIRDTSRTPDRFPQPPSSSPSSSQIVPPQRFDQGMLSGLLLFQIDRLFDEVPESGAVDEFDSGNSAVDQLDSLDAFDSTGLPPNSNEAPPEIDFDDVMSQTRDEIQVPLFGRLNVNRLGLPVFTFLIGLVDGFNPCAMWVLIFLLSVLVNVRDRRRMLLIAGTFIFVSGLAYFAFMAAWLNVFLLVGLDRPAQIVLGVAAICVGLINVKDFFAFGSGLSLKIPESAKPGIYARVRNIVTAEHLWGALIGAIVLAVLVNIIELLCTAGLPALYTEILTLQQLSPMANYLYLGLYIAAYMLDDTLMVAIVVITLSKKKLQESHGRWLKLLSGLVILVLGVVMLIAPAWLV